MAENPIDWSDWLDYNQETISEIPESPGVFMMHASMKVLLISDATNLRDGVTQTLESTCTNQATRFRYSVTEEHEKTKQDLIQDYKTRHEGNLPKCMQNN